MYSHGQREITQLIKTTWLDSLSGSMLWISLLKYFIYLYYVIVKDFMSWFHYQIHVSLRFRSKLCPRRTLKVASNKITSSNISLVFMRNNYNITPWADPKKIPGGRRECEGHIGPKNNFVCWRGGGAVSLRPILRDFNIQSLNAQKYFF